jgi:hypothetical protein
MNRCAPSATVGDPKKRVELVGLKAAVEQVREEFSAASRKAIEIPAGRANQLKKFYRQMAADVGAQVAGLSARQWLYC